MSGVAVMLCLRPVMPAVLSAPVYPASPAAVVAGLSTAAPNTAAFESAPHFDFEATSSVENLSD